MPFSSMIKKMGSLIRERIGKVLDIKEDDKDFGWGEFIRIRVGL